MDRLFFRFAKDYRVLAWLSFILFVLLRYPLIHYPYYGDEEHLFRAAIVPLGAITNAESSVFIIMLLKWAYFLIGWTDLRWVTFFFACFGISLIGL